MLVVTLGCLVFRSHLARPTDCYILELPRLYLYAETTLLATVNISFDVYHLLYVMLNTLSYCGILYTIIHILTMNVPNIWGTLYPTVDRQLHSIG